MPSAKAAQILRSRTDLTDDQIHLLSETEAWKHIYELDEQSRPLKPLSRPQICFSGFGASERAALALEAAANGLDVKESVTTTLGYLCAGSNAGPAKLEKARRLNVAVLSVEDFRAVLEQKQNA